MRAKRTVGVLQLGVDPADQIAVGKVADEQEQRVGGLIEVAVSQVMTWQRTTANVLGLGTGPAALFVAAAMEMPVGLQLRTTGTLIQVPFDIVPGRPAMPLHVRIGRLIGDALVAQSGHQPVEHNSGVAVPDRRLDLVSPQVGPNVVDQAWRACQAANGMDQPNGVVDRWPVANVGRVLMPRLETAWSCRRRNHGASNHCNEFALGIAVAVDVPLRGLDRPVTCQQLHVPQRATCLVHGAGGPSDECAAA